MNNKEVLEIKKQFTPENCSITRICGCYVDYKKERKMESASSFMSLPEEEAFKYFDLFKQTLSGAMGKKLLNIDFPLDQEDEGGTQKFLLKLRDTKLKDDDLIGDFYNRVVENYNFGENYYIVLIHGVYDVPGKASDGMRMSDASDTIYDYILCSICPVTLAKAGLSYDGENNCMVGRSRDWIVESPSKGFLFPAFNDRASDIHSVLYFSKKPEDLQPGLIQELLGAEIPLSAGSQKETFNAVLSNTLGDDCDYTTVKNIHENLNELILENKEDPDPLEITKGDMKRLLAQSGVPEEKLVTFEEDFEIVAGEKTSLLASNVVAPKKFNIEMPDIVIKVNSECADLIETKVIDNKRCLVIAINDNIQVNGVDISVTRDEDLVGADTAENDG
ncbi:MAG: DUF4317 domain-containing protein [Anaerovoracaceae bacterium]